MIEIIKSIGLFMAAGIVSVIIGLIVVYVPCIIWIVIEESFYYIKEKYYD